MYLKYVSMNRFGANYDCSADMLKLEILNHPPPMLHPFLQGVFGDHANDLYISSTKGVTGHTLGAAGGLEAIACAKVSQHTCVRTPSTFTSTHYPSTALIGSRTLLASFRPSSLSLT